MMFDKSFYKGKRVLVTGHTGFKGAWLCKMLINEGAEVTGYALHNMTRPNLFDICELDKNIYSIEGDIRDYLGLKSVFKEIQPEIVFHLAAQPIVRESYERPRDTYEVNVMGTVNLLECVRKVKSVRSVINVTTDKVYWNNEWEWGYRENEFLDGYDPYSNSKSCSELVTNTYKRSYFDYSKESKSISTVRAGNVIGGGDFARDRILPDCVRHAMKKENIIIRYPYSVRPYQYILEPLYVYLMIAALQYDNIEYAGSYNVGPNEDDCYTTKQIVEKFIDNWGEKLSWSCLNSQEPHEAKCLKLDCSKIKSIFGWKPLCGVEEAIKKTVDWTKCWILKEDVNKYMDKQIQEYMENRRNL